MKLKTKSFRSKINLPLNYALVDVYIYFAIKYAIAFTCFVQRFLIHLPFVSAVGRMCVDCRSIMLELNVAQNFYGIIYQRVHH